MFWKGEETMRESMEQLKAKVLSAVADASSVVELEAVRVSALGKKGEVTMLLRQMGSLSPEERPSFGQRVNALCGEIEHALTQKETLLAEKELALRLKSEAIDVTVPGKTIPHGNLHPLHIVQREIEEIFIGLGFDVVEGPEIELDHYNFELLNLPQDHPARDMHDTFYITENILLRTHTSPMQARYMEAHKPPLRVLCPGRVYRSDEVDASHSPVFHQIEGLVVDKNVRMSDLKGALDEFASRMFGADTRTKFRPSYFPFTEPSAEVDVSCSVCKGKGCRTCKGTGWLEVLGCGMVNPRVLSGCGIDPKEYSGYAFGMGLERITMLRYGITDMRLFYENDIRFLREF